MKKYVFPTLAVICLLLGFLIGNAVSNKVNAQRFYIQNGQLFQQPESKIDQLLDLMDEAYVEPINVDSIADEVMQELVKRLDPHSAYIPKEDLEMVNSELSASFSGIGVQFSIQNDTVQVVAVISGGPCEGMGVLAGDKIVMVNDSNFTGKNITNEKVMHALRGPKGTEVKIGVKRSGSDEVYDFTITRGDIPVHSVDAKFIIEAKDLKIGFVRVNRFGENTYDEFIAAMEDDLNTADALAAIFNLVKDINIMLGENPAKNTIQAALDLFNELTEVLGLVYVREEELLEEIIPLFESEYFHIGGDEAPKDEWKECPHCNAKMKELGYTSYEDLQGHFTKKVCEILKKHKKTPICWNDALLASNIPDDVVIQYWTIDYAKQMVPFVERQGKWIYSDMFELYLDYPHSMIPLKKIYEFEPHLYKYDMPNTDGLIGFEACAWTEHIDNEKDLCEMIFPRVYALAERANGEEHTDYESFKNRVREKVKLLEKAGIPYTKEENWDPQGKKRRDDTLDFYFHMGEGVDEQEAKKQAASAAPKIEFVIHFIKEFFKLSDIPEFLRRILFSK